MCVCQKYIVCSPFCMPFICLIGLPTTVHVTVFIYVSIQSNGFGTLLNNRLVKQPHLSRDLMNNVLWAVENSWCAKAHNGWVGLKSLDASCIWLGWKGADWFVSVSVSQLCEPLWLGQNKLGIMQESEESRDMVNQHLYYYFLLLIFFW